MRIGEHFEAKCLLMEVKEFEQMETAFAGTHQKLLDRIEKLPEKYQIDPDACAPECAEMEIEGLEDMTPDEKEIALAKNMHVREYEMEYRGLMSLGLHAQAQHLLKQMKKVEQMEPLFAGSHQQLLDCLEKLPVKCKTRPGASSAQMLGAEMDVVSPLALKFLP